MLQKLTTHDKLLLLADRIEQDTTHHFDMSSSDTCAYAFCRRMMGEEIRVEQTPHFARMLGSSEEIANNIYLATHFETSRAGAAAYIRSIAHTLEDAVA